MNNFNKMNKLFSLIFVLFSVVFSAAGQKFGFINSQEILTSLPEVKQANSDIEVMKTMFQKKGEEMVKDLQTKYGDLQKKQIRHEQQHGLHPPADRRTL